MREFHGVYVPVPTPFRGDAIAAERLKANLVKWNETPLSGYVVLGSTGEFPMLSESERDAVLVAARELPGIKTAALHEGVLTMTMEKAERRIPELVLLARERGAAATCVHMRKPSLEDVFLAYYQDSPREAKEFVNAPA